MGQPQIPHLFSVSKLSPSLCFLPITLSSFMRSVWSICLAAEGPSYPPWLISIPSDPLVYPSLLSGGWHGLVMIFPLFRLLLSNPPSPVLLWAAGSGSTQAFLSHMVNKQTITGPMTIYITVTLVLWELLHFQMSVHFCEASGLWNVWVKKCTSKCQVRTFFFFY